MLVEDLINKSFTLQDGLKMQYKQIHDWSVVLKPCVVKQLVEEARKENRALPKGATGYDVWRGTDMDGFIHNLARRK